MSSLVLDQSYPELVLHRVDQFDIANAERGLLDLSGDPFIALAANSTWPVDRGRRADLCLPLWAHGREVVGEHKARTRTVATVNGNDVLGRELHACIVGGNLGIVPLGDVPKEDGCQRFAGELEFRRLEARDVVGRNNRA